MCNYPLIHQGRAVQKVNAYPEGSPTNNPEATTDNSEQKGDLLICDLWQRGTGSIHNMRVVNTDTLYYRNNSLDKCI